MSVERVAPLGRTTTGAPTMRAPGPPAVAADPAAPAAFPPPPKETSGLYDLLAPPLPDWSFEATTTARVNALYREAATNGALLSLVDGRLPAAALRKTVETLLADLSRERGVPAAELIEGAERTASERLPSRNHATAQFSFRGRTTALDDDGRLRLLDLYLTRLSATQWEVAIFERTPTRAAGVFPRPTPLFDSHRLVIDPASGLVRACIPWDAPRGVIEGWPTPSGAAAWMRVAAAIVGAVALLMLLTRGPAWPSSALLIAALLVTLAAA